MGLLLAGLGHFSVAALRGLGLGTSSRRFVRYSVVFRVIFHFLIDRFIIQEKLELGQAELVLWVQSLSLLLSLLLTALYFLLFNPSSF